MVFIEKLNEIISTIDGYLWGPPLLILLFGTHIFLTIRTGFIQRHIFKGIKLSIAKESGGAGDVSQFGALATALAATIGTGNIIGVATAITLGGPGAVLWMWLTGVFGIATKYSEALLAVKYRVQTSDGTMLGGPMYALERGLGAKWLGVLFCVFAGIAAFGIGNTVQSQAVAANVKETFQIDPVWSGLVMTVLVGLVIIGGVRSITKVCTALVPFMALFYIIGCIIILIINRAYVGEAIAVICKAAFTPQAAGGGFIGSAVLMAARFGIARGLFSNESGLGSAPIVAAAAKTRNPVRQALVSASGTFWDTVVICLITGLVIVSSIIGNPEISGDGTIAGNALTHAAFGQIPVIGQIVLTVGLMTFAFSTILGWAYYGERSIEYLFGKKAIVPYRIIYTLSTFAGAVATLDIVWNFADAMNALMAIPNLIALIMLSGVVVEESRKYLHGNNINKIDNDIIPQIGDR